MLIWARGNIDQFGEAHRVGLALALQLSLAVASAPGAVLGA